MPREVTQRPKWIEVTSPRMRGEVEAEGFG